MIRIVIWVLVGLLIGLAAGYLITANYLLETIPKGYVSVTAINKSGNKIKTLILHHEKGSIEMNDLAEQESVKLIFKNAGENAYYLTGEFENDSTFSSSKEYVEAGYRLTEIILADTVRSDRSSY